MNELRIMDGELVFAEDFKPSRSALYGNQFLWYRPDQYRKFHTSLVPYVVVATPGPEPGIARNLNLLPGPYRFFVDVESNFVVKVAAPAAAIAAKEHERRLRQLLVETQRLDAHTMEENRNLRMTSRQLKRLSRAHGSAIGWMAIILLLFFVPGLYSDMVLHHITGFTILAAVVTVILILILPSAIRGQRRANSGTKKDVREGRLDTVEGVLEKWSRMSRYGKAVFSVGLDGETFDISDRPRLHAVLVQGCRYRAYVGRHSRRLVTIELLEGPIYEAI